MLDQRGVVCLTELWSNQVQGRARRSDYSIVIIPCGMCIGFDTLGNRAVNWKGHCSAVLTCRLCNVYVSMRLET